MGSGSPGGNGGYKWSSIPEARCGFGGELWVQALRSSGAPGRKTLPEKGIYIRLREERGARAEEGSSPEKAERRALSLCSCQSELRLVRLGLSGALPSIGGSASRKLNRACPLRLNRLFSFPTRASVPSLCFYRVPRPSFPGHKASSFSEFFREPAFCLSRTNFA